MMEKLSDDILARFRIVEEKLKEITERIRAAEEKSGRRAGEVQMLAATKTVPDIVVAHAVDCGVALIGENRVQELVEKYPLLSQKPVTQHFIGHLQTNKVRKVLGRVAVIESVDSVKLGREISRIGGEMGLTADILLEVNIGSEYSKSGVTKESVEETACLLAALPNIRVCGLMAIPPVCEKESQLHKYFSDMRELFIDIKAKRIDNVCMDYLSMGMSGDFEAAIEEGANIVRIGSALFGARK